MLSALHRGLFSNDMARLAEVSRHLTPATLGTELTKLSQNGLDILAVHIKASLPRDDNSELKALNISKLGVMEPGRTYSW